jgi:hypothetical protein
MNRFVGTIIDKDGGRPPIRHCLVTTVGEIKGSIGVDQLMLLLTRFGRWVADSRGYLL